MSIRKLRLSSLAGLLMLLPLALSLAALWWIFKQLTAWLLLAMGSTLAGNLTILGSIANIIVVEGARPKVAIGFLEYLKVGVPLTLATIIVGTLWLTMVPY